MPNNIVFNHVAEELKTLIYGQDATDVSRVILTDPDGRIEIRQLAATTDTVTVQSIVEEVTVTATDFDIRGLTAVTDTVTVQSIVEEVTVTATDFDIRQLAAATDTVSTILSGREFTESNILITNQTGSAAVLQFDTSEEDVYSYYINNTGTATFDVRLQISPTTTEAYFMDDGSGVATVGPGEKQTLVAQKFLRYTRLVYDAGAATISADCWYNAHK